MGLVTLEMGPTWKMQLLSGVLEEHGVPSFVEDSNLKVIDPFVTGALPLDARLQVPEEALEAARAALAEARESGLEDGELAEEVEAEFEREHGPELAPAPEPRNTELDALATLGRRLRWAAILVWMHPFLFLHGYAYVRELVRLRRAPAGNGMTLLALGAVTVFWGALAAEALRYLL